MEHKPASPQKTNSIWLALILLTVAAISQILASPKWSISIFAWIGPACLLYYTRTLVVRRKFLWMFPALVIMEALSSFDVAPFPLAVLLVIGILESLKIMVLYLTDKWVVSKNNRFLATLYFPAISVTLEYINTRLGGGVWWSVANSQYPFAWLSQLSSVAGIWGISFVIYWSASVSVWVLQRKSEQKSFKKGAWIYGGVLGAVLIFGGIRYNVDVLRNEKQVKVAGLSVPLMSFMENLYKDYSGKTVTINPKTSITSGVLQQVNQAQLPFIETADTLKFKNGYRAMMKLNDSLFALSQKAADGGAKIILWSEANGLAFNFDEHLLLERGKQLAAKNKVYFLIALAIIEPGKIVPGKKFIKNEAVLFGPDGQTLNVFHKNKPVPMVENSKPGDGVIPVIQTEYGRISTSICYDADFPVEMRQLGTNKTDILLLPSGDWYAISPYHTHMAIFRGIENGCAVIRQASGGLSVASDYRGSVNASLDFYIDGEKLWFASIPVGHVTTIYSKLGDWLPYACIAFVLACLGLLLAPWIRMKIAGKRRFDSSELSISQKA